MMHQLPAEPVVQDCLTLMARLNQHGRLDFDVPLQEADPCCTTADLFGEGGGKMFGMLACRAQNGERVVLRSFSGQYNGVWHVPGWVGPVFDTAAFNELVRIPEREIKRLGRELGVVSKGSVRFRQLRSRRKYLSQQLMQAIHDLYQLTNFRGEQVSLLTAFIGAGAPPAGTADCCGPKLLYHAAEHGLVPEAMAEFYWGRSNASATKLHGAFYSACVSKCQPILGFMLCGAGSL